MSWEPLFTSAAGIKYVWKDDPEGNLLIKSYQSVEDMAAILENNQRLATHNDGYTQSRDMARIASIPLAIIYKWMTEEGWDPFSQDPDCQRKLAQKLDDPEYRYLRTSEIILGDHWKHHQ